MKEKKDITDLLVEKQYSRVCCYLDTDINNLSTVVEAIESNSMNKLLDLMSLEVNDESHRDEFILCCVYSIISNPFNFKSILDEKSFNTLLDFSIKEVNKYEIGKLAVSSIVFLSKQDILVYKKDGKFFIKDTQISPETAYSFLSQYSKGRRIMIDFFTIDNSNNLDFNINLDKQIQNEDLNFLSRKDNSCILQAKIEILANQLKHYNIKKEVLEDFTKMLNVQNVSVGWTLAKAMASISKYFDIENIIEDLKSRCTELFANESLWINTLSILGILTLKGIDVGYVEDIVRKALLYDNEFVHRSSLLREHSIFLIWTLIKRQLVKRDEKSLSNYFDLLVFTIILDSSLNVRRASVSVIAEYIGVFNLKSGYSFLNLFEKNYHKRLNNADLLINELSVFYDLKSFSKSQLESKLSHYEREVQEVAAYLIVKFYNPMDFFRFEPVLNRGSLYILLYALKERTANEEMKQIFLVKITDRIYKLRNSEISIYLYLRCLLELVEVELKMPILSFTDISNKQISDFLKEGIILDNLFFILTKNVFPKETSALCWALANDSYRSKLLINLRRNNESFILVNARNKAVPIPKYKDNLRNTNIDIRIWTIKSIKYMTDISIFKEEIERGLEDYEVDRRGDISYLIRLECLYLGLSLGINIEKYIIRFLVDKSKFLRDYTVGLLNCLGLLRYNNTVVYQKKGFTVLNSPSTDLNEELRDFLEVQKFNLPFSEKFKEFLRIFEDKMREIENTEFGYFKGMIFASGCLEGEGKENFSIGIENTISKSNSRLSEFLEREWANK